MHYLPATEAELAGLVLFQNEAFHITLGVTLIDGQNHVILQKAERAEDQNVNKVVLASERLPARFNGVIGLKAEMNYGQLAFSYRVRNRGNWNLLMEGIDATYLSTARATGFIGTILALYASTNE